MEKITLNRDKPNIQEAFGYSLDKVKILNDFIDTQVIPHSSWARRIENICNSEYSDKDKVLMLISLGAILEKIKTKEAIRKLQLKHAKD